MTHAERRAALEAIAADVRSCTGCRLHETRTNAVPGEGHPDTEVVFVGEGPGFNEDRLGRPFVGRAGKLLDSLLAEAGLAREDVYITNVVKARPPGNRDPKAPEVAHHIPWLEQQLALVKPSVVIPLGRHALAHFAPGRKITEVHGELVVERERRLVPWLHPAAALRNRDLRETPFADARALPGILASIG